MANKACPVLAEKLLETSNAAKIPTVISVEVLDVKATKFNTILQRCCSDAPQMVASVDERGSTLEFLHEESEKMRFIWVVETLNTSF